MLMSKCVWSFRPSGCTIEKCNDQQWHSITNKRTKLKRKKKIGNGKNTKAHLLAAAIRSFEDVIVPRCHVFPLSICATSTREYSVILFYRAFSNSSVHIFTATAQQHN